MNGEPTGTSAFERLAQESLAEIERLEKELALGDDSLSYSMITNASDISMRKAFVDVDYSFGLAEAESEREVIQDKYDELLYKNSQLEEQHQKDLKLIEEYAVRCAKLDEELYLLRFQQSIRSPRSRASTLSRDASMSDDSQTIKQLREELLQQNKRFDEMEFRLAQAKCALANAQQAQEDFLMSQELTEKERDKERTARILAEKERDAYAAAYESSRKQLSGKPKTTKSLLQKLNT